MTINEGKQKRRARESAEQRAERIEHGDLAREAGQDADDANVQQMIERSIRDHGA